MDLGGRVVLPGFIDSHVHLTSTGNRLLETGLTGAESIDDVLRLLISGQPPGDGPVQGHGLNYHLLSEKRFPTLGEMSQAFPDRPAFAFDQSGHAVVTNSLGLAMLKKAGVSVDEESAATGLLVRSAAYSARETLLESRFTKEGLREAWTVAWRRALEMGITAIHALEGPLSDLERCDGHRLEVLKDLAGSAPIDITLYYQTLDVEAVLEAGLGQIGGCILVDGAFSPWTAALYEPYSDKPENSGQLYIPHDDLLHFVGRAHRAGLQVALHACGDRAIGECLEAYASALERFPREDHRHRVEHFEIPTREQIQEASRLGVHLGMQPSFDYYWDMDYYTEKLGAKRALRKNAFSSILEAGIVVGGGSDSEVTPMNPLLGVYSAVMSSNKRERIGVREALGLFGAGAARLAFHECLMGSIQVGKRADMVVLSGDPLEIEPASLLDIEVEATMVGGELLYQRENWV
jgi:predicted amidohydrolase YtcJ